ncbi:hypothetical protein HRUBRA_01275 [Pseudohaliea rubra DSM 19751]|uniref:Uncharacterized protein n=1 Tax=Pseudohaliea rubra DSM 19751 TaxID=1265313 RepID=A0A095XWI5_9GAMM|nr:hypothetical protein HRUBRA_01275 [Pseudohaliea rubra DSM 19751]
MIDASSNGGDHGKDQGGGGPVPYRCRWLGGLAGPRCGEGGHRLQCQAAVLGGLRRRPAGRLRDRAGHPAAHGPPRPGPGTP